MLILLIILKIVTTNNNRKNSKMIFDTRKELLNRLNDFRVITYHFLIDYSLKRKSIFDFNV